MNKCDFCGYESKKDMPWEYPCQDFQTIITFPAWSKGSWAACTYCKGMIERGHWNDLAIKAASLHEMVKTGTLGFDEAILIIKELHEEFQEHRIGPVRRLVR